jgi:glucokinase
VTRRFFFLMMRIGVDLGGHTLTAALISQGEKGKNAVIDRMLENETPKGRDLESVISMMAGMILDLSRGRDIDGVGVAVPAMLDFRRGRTLEMPNFPDEWDNVDIADALFHALAPAGLNSRILIENDANCYALGEGIAGQAAGLLDYAVFTMGTGIGCGILIGGKLLTGAHGMAGECGHVVVGGMETCGCGGIGHAETMAATDGTLRRAGAEGLTGNFKDLWAMRGDVRANRVLDVTIDGMARAVATLCHTIDPEAIIIGGGMSKAPGIVEAIREASMKYLALPYRNNLDLRVSTAGSAAALYGAANI